MPTYDYRCDEHGDFEAIQRMKDHARAFCPTCGSDSAQVVKTAPRPLIEKMADAGCPGAFETSGNRIAARHRKAGQDWAAP
jgi:putative FmdB family regulatory protein